MDSDIDWQEIVYEFVRTIPPGKVMTYGQVADSIRGVSVTARMVGSAMSMVPAGVPWQRVVGTGGHLPIGKRSAELKIVQVNLLKREGVFFRGKENDLVDLAVSGMGFDEPKLFDLDDDSTE